MCIMGKLKELLGKRGKNSAESKVVIEKKELCSAICETICEKHDGDNEDFANKRLLICVSNKQLYSSLSDPDFVSDLKKELGERNVNYADFMLVSEELNGTKIAIDKYPSVCLVEKSLNNNDKILVAIRNKIYSIYNGLEFDFENYQLLIYVNDRMVSLSLSRSNFVSELKKSLENIKMKFAKISVVGDKPTENCTSVEVDRLSVCLYLQELTNLEKIRKEICINVSKRYKEKKNGPKKKQLLVYVDEEEMYNELQKSVGDLEGDLQREGIEYSEIIVMQGETKDKFCTLKIDTVSVGLVEQELRDYNNAIESQEKWRNAILNAVNANHRGIQANVENRHLLVYINNTMMYTSMLENEFVPNLRNYFHNEGYVYREISVHEGRPTNGHIVADCPDICLVEEDYNVNVARSAVIRVIEGRGSTIEPQYELSADEIGGLPGERYNIGVGVTPQGMFRTNQIAISDDINSNQYENNSVVSRSHAFITFSEERGFMLYAEARGTRRYNHRTQIQRGNRLIEIEENNPIVLRDEDDIILSKKVMLRFNVNKQIIN